MTHKTVEAPVRVAVIGAGFWAVSNHIPILAARDDVELVSVCRIGRTELDLIQSEYGFKVATEDYREALDAGVDVAVISSPNNLHHEHAMAALERDLHVMVEKPLAPTAKEAWDIVELAEARGLHVLVPHGWHYKDFIRRARTLIEDGCVGEIKYMLCHMASPTVDLFEGRGGYGTFELGGRRFEAAPSTWSSPHSSGGYALGQMTHSVGLLSWITGLSVSNVFARSRQSSTSVDVADAAVAEFEGGALASISGCGLAPSSARFQVDIRIFGDEGMLLLDVERERLQLERHDGDDEIVTPEPGTGDYECETPPGRFIELVRGVHSENNSPGEVAARTVEVIEAIGSSVESGGVAEIGRSVPR